MRRTVFVLLLVLVTFLATSVFQKEGLVNLFHQPTEQELTVYPKDIFTTAVDPDQMVKGMMENTKNFMNDFKRTPVESFMESYSKAEVAEAISQFDVATVSQDEFSLKDLTGLTFLYEVEESSGLKMVKGIQTNAWIPLSFVTNMKFPLDAQPLKAGFELMARNPATVEQGRLVLSGFQQTIMSYKTAPDAPMTYNGKPWEEAGFAFTNDEVRMLRSWVGPYQVLLSILENSIKHRRVQGPNAKKQLESIAGLRGSAMTNWPLAYANWYRQEYHDELVKSYYVGRLKAHWETPAFFLLVLLGIYLGSQAIGTSLHLLARQLILVEGIDYPQSEHVNTALRRLYKGHFRYRIIQPLKPTVICLLGPICKDVANEELVTRELFGITNEADQIRDQYRYFGLTKEIEGLHRKATDVNVVRSVRANALKQLRKELVKAEEAEVRRIEKSTSNRRRDRYVRKTIEEITEVTVNRLVSLLGDEKYRDKLMDPVRWGLMRLEYLQDLIELLGTIQDDSSKFTGDHLSEIRDMLGFTSDLRFAIGGKRANIAHSLILAKSKESESQAPAKVTISVETVKSLPSLSGLKVVVVGDHLRPKEKERLIGFFQDLGAREKDCSFHGPDDERQLAKAASVKIAKIFILHKGRCNHSAEQALKAKKANIIKVDSFDPEVMLEKLRDKLPAIAA